MTDSPVEYLRKTIFDAITEEFPTPFTYFIPDNLEYLLWYEVTVTAVLK